MLSEKQLEANRANAQKSTGPKTAEGKKRSSLNALRHGLTAQVFVIPEEDLAALNQFTGEIVAAFDPVGPIERNLAQSYATFQWRINRIAAMEETMLTFGLMEEIAENYNIEHPQAHNATSHAKTFRRDSEVFSRLCLYSHRLVSQAEKVLKQLKQMQAERKEQERREMSEARKVYSAFKKLGATFNPKDHGFVLTTAQIESDFHRQNLADPAYIAKILVKAA